MVWEREEYRILCELTGNVSSVTAIAISPDQQHLFVGCADGSLKSWELSSPKKRSHQIIAAHKGKINALIFTQDGDYLLSGGADGKIKCWEPNHDRPCRVFSFKEDSETEPTPVTSLVLSRDDHRLFAGDMQGRIQCWYQSERITPFT